MTTLATPRTQSSVVRLSEPGFSGEMHTICQLPLSPSALMLRRLMAGDQLACTPSGSHVAIILTRDQEEELFHSGFDARMVFQRLVGKDQGGTRILRVHDNHVLVWGQVRGYAPGVWLIAAGLRQYLFPMNRMVGSYTNGAVRMPVGEQAAFPGENVIITPWGLLPIATGAKVELYADETLCVVEELGGRSYAYEISQDGIEPFSPCTIDPTIRFVRWQGQHLLATRTPYRSLLIETGKHVDGKPRLVPIDGQLEEVWSSPTHLGLLTLVRPRDAAGDERRLLLNNQTLVHEGAFTLARPDVFWSQSGTSFAARMRVKLDGKWHEHLVTPVEDREFPEGVVVREVLVSDAGAIEAVIVHDGVWDKPIVHGRRLTAVPLAWNLHEHPDGSIVWNTVHDDLILRWIDRTHLEARPLRPTTTR